MKGMFLSPFFFIKNVVKCNYIGIIVGEGEKMATIKEIAQLTGVSITTVSRVLNQDRNFVVSDETRLKIIQTAERLNYITPANRNLKLKNNKSRRKIGLVYWYTTNEEINDPYYLSIRLAIENECKRNNINLEVIHMTKDQDANIENLKADGVIALGKYSQNFINRLYAKFNNVVIVDCPCKHYFVDTVTSDLAGAMEEILDYYFCKDIKRVGFICGVEHTFDGEELLDIRLVAYKKEMYLRGAFNQNDIYLGKFTADSGYEIMSEIINKDELLDGYIVASDSMAIGCLKALNENNIRVPDVVSIISYNNTSLAQFTIPSLTSVNINTKLMGESAVDLLVERFATGRQVAKKVTIPTNIIFRDSCVK